MFSVLRRLLSRCMGGGFSVVDQVRALQDRRSYVLVQAEHKHVLGGHRVFVRKRTRCATTPTERKRFESDRKFWRMAAGGGLMVLRCLDCSVALVRYRDSGAPSYGDRWTLGSGLSANIGEVVNPMLVAIREAIEEFGIITPRGILIPQFGDQNLDKISMSAVRSAEFLRQVATLQGYDTSVYLSARAALVDLHGEERLTVAFEEARETTMTGIVVIDKNTRGIDLLKLISVEVPFRLDQISVVDGEEDRQGKSLDAPVGCLPFDGLSFGREFVTVFQHGELQDPTKYRMEHVTPVLQAFFDRMK